MRVNVLHGGLRLKAGEKEKRKECRCIKSRRDKTVNNRSQVVVIRKGIGIAEETRQGSQYMMLTQ